MILMMRFPQHGSAQYEIDQTGAIDIPESFHTGSLRKQEGRVVAWNQQRIGCWSSCPLSIVR
jgi:hypothetical protein